MAEYLTRYLEPSISEDFQRKMVFIGGPRQSGQPWRSICVSRRAVISKHVI